MSFDLTKNKIGFSHNVKMWIFRLECSFFHILQEPRVAGTTRVSRNQDDYQCNLCEITYLCRRMQFSHPSNMWLLTAHWQLGMASIQFGSLHPCNFHEGTVCMCHRLSILNQGYMCLQEEEINLCHRWNLIVDIFIFQ